jgi:4-amino-4-deoxy-L-arabinose transferase-like glycosyltransferase
MASRRKQASSPESGLEAPLRLTDRWMAGLLALVFALELMAWSGLVGYSEADAIEFVSRAQMLVTRGNLGEVPTLRPFTFSLLFVPLFHFADVVGLEDPRWIFRFAICMQMVFSLALVFITARLAAQAAAPGAARRTGLAAGFLLGTNPIFLHYSVLPVSGIAAALCVAAGLKACLSARGFRRGLKAGLWFGLGMLVAYQSLMLGLLAGALLFARQPRKGRAVWLGLAAGMLAAFPIGMLVDRVMYGRFGASLGPYLVVNFGYILVRLIADLGLRGLGTSLYEWLSGLHGGEIDPRAYALPLAQMQGRWWYLETLPMVLVWPVIAFGVLALCRLTLAASKRAGALLLVLLGVGALALATEWSPARFLVLVPLWALVFVWVRALLRGEGPQWRMAFLSLLVLASALIMSSKGNKLFRLWLPLLPALAVVCAWGWSWLAGRSLPRLAPALVLLSVVLPWTRVPGNVHGFDRYGAYWKAAAFVNAEVSSMDLGGDARDQILASAYQWAIYMRPSPRIENAVFPFVLDTWESRSDEEKSLLIALLDRLDWLLVHEPVLTMHPELMREVNHRMEVRAAFFDPEQQGALRPVFVLGRRTGTGHTFFDVSRADPIEAAFSVATGPRPVHFKGQESPAPELTLLDVEVKTLPGDGYGWLTWHWRADSELEDDYRVLGRISGPGGVHLWHNPHDPAYGVLPTSTWKRGWVVRESYIVATRLEATEQLERTGLDLDPSNLDSSVWVTLNQQTNERRTISRLEVFRPGEDRAVRATLPRGRFETEDGFVFSKDGMVRVGALRMALEPQR